jgi:hypothetical protein
VIEALSRPDSMVARQAKSELEIASLRDYLHKLTGMDDEFCAFLSKEGKAGVEGVLTALGAWLLCVEYVQDLQREPELTALRRLNGLAGELVKVCRKLVNDLGDRHADACAEVADAVEGLIHGELDVMTAEDLGHVAGAVIPSLSSKTTGDGTASSQTFVSVSDISDPMLGWAIGLKEGGCGQAGGQGPGRSSERRCT